MSRRQGRSRAPRGRSDAPGGRRGDAPSRRQAPAQVRVQRYLSQAGVASRRQAEALVGQGRVDVNGRPVREMGVRIAPGIDVVAVDGRVVESAPLRWLVFHKPVGVLCTRSDPHGGETVYDVLPDWSAGLRYVGRLDRDTSGLLLMTNDGALAAALAHPRNRIEREYVATVKRPVTAQSIRAIKAGVELEDGFARPKRVRRTPLDGGEWGVTVVLAEGRKRQVRRLLRAAGCPVASLRRVRFGPFRLGSLKPGRWRPARASEITTARSQVRPPRAGRARGQQPQRKSS